MSNSSTNHDNRSYSHGLHNISVEPVEQLPRSLSEAYISSFDHQYQVTVSQPHLGETSISSSVNDQIHGLESLPLPEKPPSFDEFTAASEALQRGIFNKLEREVWDRINGDTKTRIKRWLGKGFKEGDETYKDFISTLLKILQSGGGQFQYGDKSLFCRCCPGEYLPNKVRQCDRILIIVAGKRKVGDVVGCQQCRDARKSLRTKEQGEHQISQNPVTKDDPTHPPHSSSNSLSGMITIGDDPEQPSSYQSCTFPTSFSPKTCKEPRKTPREPKRERGYKSLATSAPMPLGGQNFSWKRCADRHCPRVLMFRSHTDGETHPLADRSLSAAKLASSDLTKVDLEAFNLIQRGQNYRLGKARLYERSSLRSMRRAGGYIENAFGRWIGGVFDDRSSSLDSLNNARLYRQVAFS
ncbi:hypothetical protein FFLO_00291 [Filobasidium floriforme]|uniref:Uncharacterized protein n=1 Tax=Filobasidium floriforme TaxID=5210 RepID=A0A8K0JWL8_9TREE|nr:uncharacterized protein HD553DRAFT_324895 [Filobasidium floriforme]KAG7575472.1 hypothetical protein FFLO_00291 [Filobasidium floriforme]KAH8082609.1 hypothetical protein HD553DRAFT_324895 [Filobasidium floriforme]